MEIKQYFFQQIEPITFGLYSITLNKRRLYEQLTLDKGKTYNWVARQVIDEIPFEQAEGGSAFNFG